MLGNYLQLTKENREQKMPRLDRYDDKDKDRIQNWDVYSLPLDHVIWKSSGLSTQH